MKTHHLRNIIHEIRVPNPAANHNSNGIAAVPKCRMGREHARERKVR